MNTQWPPALPTARDLEIRHLAESDFPAVLAIQDACYAAITPESCASLLAKYRESPRTCFAAWSGGQVVGYVIAVPIAWPHIPPLGAETFAVPAGADTLYLHDLALMPGIRGCGAGAALVRKVLEAGRRLGWRKAGLVAIQGSSSFWGRFGFERVEPSAEAATQLASYGDAVLMSLPRRGRRLPAGGGCGTPASADDRFTCTDCGITEQASGHA